MASKMKQQHFLRRKQETLSFPPVSCNLKKECMQHKVEGSSRKGEAVIDAFWTGPDSCWTIHFFWRCNNRVMHDTLSAREPTTTVQASGFLWIKSKTWCMHLQINLWCERNAELRREKKDLVKKHIETQGNNELAKLSIWLFLNLSH